MFEHSRALELGCFLMVLGVYVSQIDLIPRISTSGTNWNFDAGEPYPTAGANLISISWGMLVVVDSMSVYSSRCSPPNPAVSSSQPRV